MVTGKVVNFVVTLKSGGDFKPYDAETLCRQVMKHMMIPHKFIVYTDYAKEDFEQETVKYMEIRELKKDLPGWWSMVEMFRTTGPTIASGLDMIVVNNIDRLVELARTCPDNVLYMADPQRGAKLNGELYCSGLQIWNGNWTWLFKLFKDEDFKYAREQKYTYTKVLERNFDIRKVQEYFDGYYSFKHGCKRGRKPKDATVVLFHGVPRPNQCEVDWVKDIYWNTEIPVHPFEAMKEKADAESNKDI